MCECEDKVVLIEAKPTDSIAEETWCPTHGYENSCWMCDLMNNHTTEGCVKHRRESEHSG